MFNFFKNTCLNANPQVQRNVYQEMFLIQPTWQFLIPLQQSCNTVTYTCKFAEVCRVTSIRVCCWDCFHIGVTVKHARLQLLDFISTGHFVNDTIYMYVWSSSKLFKFILEIGCWGVGYISLCEKLKKMLKV